MEDEDEPVSPFWLSNNKNRRKPINNLRERSASFLLNSTVFIVLLLVIAILFIFIIIPSIRNATSQMFKPQLLVRKSWDYVNLVLVLFAIVCAFLSRNTEDENQNQNQNQNQNRGFEVSSVSFRSQDKWYENVDRSFNSRSFNRLKSSNSYPELRQESESLLAPGDDHRFYDDTHLIDHRFINESSVDHRHRRQQNLPELRPDLLSPLRQETVVVKRDVEQAHQVEVIESARDAPLYSPPTALPTPLVDESPLSNPPSLTQSTAVKRKTDQRPHRPRANQHQELPRRLVTKSKQEASSSRSPPSPVTPPLSPPPSPPPSVRKGGRSDRKRSGSGSSSTKDLLALLSQPKRKKKQRQKSVENFDVLLQPSQPPSSPPPPPPPPVTESKITKHKSSSSTTKTSRIINAIDHDSNNLSSGNNSPFRIPPPPPPPPFRMKSWKFLVKGDYVRINSTGSSSSESPDLDNFDQSSRDSPSSPPPPPPQSAIFCPSPDVDSKADNFIARFRAGLKLEKVSSINDKHGIGLSKLGPDPSPNPSPNHIF